MASGPGGRFRKGEGGRPKGRKNDRTLVRESLGLSKEQLLELVAEGDPKLKLPPRHVRLARLLLGPKPVAAALERDLMLHAYGRPKETVELVGGKDFADAVAAAFDRARAHRDRGSEE